jgi:hypothetical protein
MLNKYPQQQHNDVDCKACVEIAALMLKAIKLLSCAIAMIAATSTFQWPFNF